MATVGGPPTSLTAARGVYGAGPGSLRQLLRGQGLVPNIPQNAGVPTSGNISLLQLVGSTNYVPMAVNVNQTGGTRFESEPAPVSQPVTGSLSASATNGTGSYSYSWSLVSAGGSNTGFSWSVSGPQGQVVTATAPVTKNVERQVEFQLTVSDGVTTSVTNRTLSLRYETNA